MFPCRKLQCLGEVTQRDVERLRERVPRQQLAHELTVGEVPYRRATQPGAPRQVLQRQMLTRKFLRERYSKRVEIWFALSLWLVAIWDTHTSRVCSR